MKNFTITSAALIAIVFFFNAFQLKAQETVNEELLVKEWIDGQVLTIFDHQIMRVFGETYDKNTIRNYHIPVTNVGYKDLAQLKDETNQLATNEDWPGEKLDDALLALEDDARGGRIYVYIERKENDRARSNYFFVVLRDKNEEEVYKSNVEGNEPQFGDFGFWSNYFVLDVPIELAYPFYIYVDDRKSRNLSDFKFEVLE